MVRAEGIHERDISSSLFLNSLQENRAGSPLIGVFSLEKLTQLRGTFYIIFRGEPVRLPDSIYFLPLTMTAKKPQKIPLTSFKNDRKLHILIKSSTIFQ